MPSYNKVLLMGHLTRDPELRVTPRGTSICQFSLAVNRTFSTESGEKREEVIFVDIEAWGKQAEVAGKYLAKGRPVFVEGRLKLDQWEDKATGQKRSRMKVVLENMQFLEDRQGGAEPARKDRPTAAPQTNPNPPPQRQPTAEGFDEDVPF